MKNDSTSFFENNHFANSYVYDISISHVPAYFGLHWHHYIEIVLAQDDGIIYEVNGETFPLKPGDLLFIWPGELHAVSTINREHRLIMLQLDADFLEKLRGFLTELRRLSLSGISFSELRGCVLLYQFFILLGENLSVPTETAAPQKTGHSAQVHRQMIAACTWISSHCTEPVSLEEASKVAGFSRCHFSKLFRAYTGLSFTDFVTRERLHIAENLLKKPDLTITEVSLESGFNSISTFNRVFLKSKNVSPTDFRQMYLQSYQK